MAINITFDNNRETAALETLTCDENLGAQTQITTDDGDEVDVTLSDPVNGTIGGLTTVMNGILNSASIFGFTNFKLSDAQKIYLASNDAASSELDFVKVETTNGETVDDLFFSDEFGNDLEGVEVVGMKTLDNQSVYLWSSGDLAIATTSDVLGDGRIVAVFTLQEDSEHLEAQIQMAAFEPLSHPDDADADDALNFTDILNVSASGSISFDFEELKSGSSLWVAVGNSDRGLLVTGGDPDVDGANKKTNESDVIHTSQGGVGATIGVNNQLFDNVGETAVITLVTGLASLGTAPDAGATGDYTIDPLPNKKPIEGIDYEGYINTNGAGIFLSQSQGNDPKNLDIKLWEAGGDPSDPQTEEDLANYIPGLGNDTEVTVASVTITDDDGAVVGVWGAGGTLSSGDAVNDHESTNGTADIVVSFSGNTINVVGVLGEYTVSWTSAAGETFNRFDVIAQGGQFDIGRVDVDNVVGDTEAVGSKLIVDDAGPVIGAIANSTVAFTTGATSGNVALLDLPRTDLEGNLEITDFTSSFTILGKTIEGQINAANTEVKYFEDTNNNDTLDAGETHWYTLSLTQNGNPADFYNFTVVNAPAAPPLTFGFDNLPSGANMFGSVADSNDGPGLFVFGRDVELKPDGSGKGTNTSDVIHTSQGGILGATIGVNNQMFDGPNDEGAYFTFVDDIVDSFLAGSGKNGLSSTEADDADNIQYDGGLHDTPSAFFGMSQGQGNDLADLKLSAFHLDTALEQEALIEGSGQNPTEITRVVIYADDLITVLEDTDPGGADDPNIEVDLSGDTAVITNLAAGMKVEWYTDTPHNQVLVEAVTGKFDIGFFGFNEPQDTPDHSLTFEVTVTDGDGDTALDEFTVNVDAIPFV